MNDTNKPSLKEFLIKLAADNADNPRKYKQGRGAAKAMYEAARKAGYDCTQTAINNMRYQYKLGMQYEGMQKAARKRQQAAVVKTGAGVGAGQPKKKPVKRRRYASAAAAAAAKYAAQRTRRKLALAALREKEAQANGSNGHAEVEKSAARISNSERGFLDAVALVGLERAEGLLARFKKQARS